MPRKIKLAWIVKNLIKLAYVLISVVIVLLLAYFFGFFLLRNPLMGSDSTNSLTFIVWLDRYYPKIPFWYPLQGAGSSFVTGYPILYSLLVVWVHRLSALSLTQAMALLNYLIIPLGGLGAYFFVLTRFRNMSAALMSGVFYLLSPMLYVWIYGAGFLAQTFSFIFVAPSLLFYDVYLERKLAEKKGWLTRFSLLGIIVSLTLAMLAHPATAIGVLVTLGLYSILYPVFVFPKEKIQRLVVGIATYVKTVLAFFLAVAWWFVPFYHYTGLASQGINPLLVDPKTLPPVEILPTLGILSNNGYPYPDFSIVIPVVILALVGLILGYFFSRKTFVLGLLAFFNLLITGTFALNFFFNRLSPTLGAVFSLRYGVGLSLFLTPVVAGLGLYYLVNLLFIPLRGLVKEGKGKVIKESLLLLLVPLVGLVILFLLNSKATPYQERNTLYYGPSVAGINLNYPFIRTPQHQVKNLCTGDKSQPLECTYSEITDRVDPTYFLSLCNLLQQQEDKRCITFPSYVSNDEIKKALNKQMETFVSSCKDKKSLTILENDICLAIIKDPIQKLAPNNWPVLAIDGPDLNSIGTDIASKEVDNFDRVDLSPSVSGLLTFNIKHNVSVVNAYTGQLILNKPMLGLFQHTFYTSDNEPINFNNLASWFGVDAIFINPATDPISKFDQAGWETRSLIGTQARLPEKSAGLADLSSKPLILAIGDANKNAYEHVFRAALGGVFPYQDAWLVQGNTKIDSYNIADLQKFSWIVLHGYSYDDKNRAWGLINDYLADGGHVFVDTGWQFVDKDWGKGPNADQVYDTIDLPQPFPVGKTTWGQIGQSWGGVSFADVNAEQNKEKFSPLTADGKAWGLALGEKNSLRDNSKILISSGDNVLMASRNVGKGEIVWSGIDLFSHALANKNQDELNFLKNVFNLKPAAEIKVNFQRETPDKIVFDVNKQESDSYLLWKEYYYPGWHANLVTSNGNEALKVTQAGPGFMLISIPAGESGKMVLNYEQPFLYTLARLVSVIAVLLLLLNLFWLQALNYITEKIVPKKVRTIPKLNLVDDEES